MRLILNIVVILAGLLVVGVGIWALYHGKNPPYYRPFFHSLLLGGSLIALGSLSLLCSRQKVRANSSGNGVRDKREIAARAVIGAIVALAGTLVAAFGTWAKFHGKGAGSNNGLFYVLAPAGVALLVVGLLFALSKGSLSTFGEKDAPGSNTPEQEMKDA